MTVPKIIIMQMAWLSESKFPSLPVLQLPGSSHACSISLHTEHLWGWCCLLLLFFGQMPPDPRLHNSQHLSRRAAEGPRTPCVLCSTHLAHLVPPWSQPSATCPHQGNLQPLYQADLKTHPQVNALTHSTWYYNRPFSKWLYWEFAFRCRFN